MKERKKYLKILNGVIAVLSILALLLVMSNLEFLKKDMVSGEEYEQSSDYHSSEIGEREDSIQQSFRLQHSGLESISIRVEDRDSDMTGDLLVRIRCEEELVFEYQIPSADLENWRYVSVDVSEAKLKPNRIYTLNISSPESGQETPYRLYLTGVPIRENEALMCDGSPVDAELDMVYQYHLFDASAIVFWIVSESAIFLFGFFFVQNPKEKLGKVLAVVGSAGVLVYLTQALLGEGTIAELSLCSLILNLLIVLGVYGLLLVLTGKYSVSIDIAGVLFFLLAVANHYVLEFRGTIIMPSDIYSIQTAADVAENYKLFLDRDLLMGCQTLLVTLILVHWLVGASDRASRKKVFAAEGAAICLILAVIANRSLQSFLGTGTDQGRQNARSEEIGYLLNLCENIPYLIYKEPKGYSLEKVETLLTENEEDMENGNAETCENPESSEAAELPENIIVIMNESFTDLGYLGEVETDQECLQNFYQLAEEENSKSGKCVVSVFGGGTSCTEFEFLTGCSMVFLGSGNAPYQQYVHTETGSLARFLKQNDYGSLALHPANPRSWNRHVAYPLLGFDEFLNIDSDEFADATTCRYWADDASLMTEMYRQSENSEKLFQFGLTIQCHGGYDYSGNDFESTVQIENYNDEDGSVSQYLTLLSMSDQAFGEMIGNLKESDQKTLVLMFGDHLPSLNSEFYNQLLDEEDEDTRAVKLHETPYLFWANYNIDFDGIPDVLSANFLSSYLLKSAGIPLSSYYQYLYELSQEYPVISRTAVLDSEGNIVQYTKGEECYERIHEYEMTQYAVLHGNMLD